MVCPLVKRQIKVEKLVSVEPVISPDSLHPLMVFS
jgi:hypothetical protein